MQSISSSPMECCFSLQQVYSWCDQNCWCPTRRLTMSDLFNLCLPPSPSTTCSPCSSEAGDLRHIESPSWSTAPPGPSPSGRPLCRVDAPVWKERWGCHRSSIEWVCSLCCPNADGKLYQISQFFFEAVSKCVLSNHTHPTGTRNLETKDGNKCLVVCL